MERTFTSTIKESSRELTAKEKVKFKDVSNALRLDEVTETAEHVVIAPDFYVVLSIHNEKADNKDYDQYVIVDKEGTKYVTSSTSFWNSFYDIFSDMEEVDEDWEIEVLKKPSTNYKGKYFLTCALL